MTAKMSKNGSLITICFVFVSLCALPLQTISAEKGICIGETAPIFSLKDLGLISGLKP